MQLSVHSTPLWQDIKACYLRQNTVTESYGQPLKMNKMLGEKEVLEQGLADCVISLQALNKKQARNERQLGKVATLSRKKQKHLQQIKRDLARDMRNLERDEQAFLFNLQACKVSIQACNTWVAYDAALSTWIDTAVTPTLCTPTLYSSSGTETTESSWYSWNGPDTARTQWLQSKLDPEADVFQPQDIRTQHVQAPRYPRLRAKSI
jgi:hypothetical protein